MAVHDVSDTSMQSVTDSEQEADASDSLEDLEASPQKNLRKKVASQPESHNFGSRKLW